MDENTIETKIKWLVEDFLDDLDSWFSADIKCCEKCYSDFIKNWPMIIQRSNEFFSIDLESFYAGSRRIKENYSLKEFVDNIHLVKCPRCGESIEDIIYPFEFHFCIDEDFEFDVNLLKQTILETPFIVLKNSLANRVFDVINEQIAFTEKTLIDFPLYRGRVIKKEDICGDSFLAPPKELTREGRYNHNGIPVIYSANKKITCYNELRKPENDFFIAEFSLKKKLILLNLNNINAFDEKNDLLKSIVWSSLCSAKTEDEAKHKPEYYFTRFISDCCKYLGFDGLIYPSVQIGTGENYVFFDTNLFSDKNLITYYEYKKQA